MTPLEQQARQLPMWYASEHFHGYAGPPIDWVGPMPWQLAREAFDRVEQEPHILAIYGDWRAQSGDFYAAIAPDTWVRPIIQKPRHLSVTETAKLVRGALKKAFPTVKFSVRSSSYSGGASIDVRYTDGPRIPDVEKVTDAFVASGFDGSIDLKYHLYHWLLPNGSTIIAHSPGTQGSGGFDPKIDRPIKPHDSAELVSFGSDHVHVHRNMSARTLRRIVARVCRRWGLDPERFPVEESEHYTHARGACETRVEKAGEYLDKLIWREERRAFVTPAGLVGYVKEQ